MGFNTYIIQGLLLHSVTKMLPSFCKDISKLHLYAKKRTIISIRSWSSLVVAWQRPTLPGPCGPSTIGAGGLNGRVRDGYVWNPSAIATKHEFAPQILP